MAFENRQHRRIPVKIKLRFRTPADVGMPSTTAETVNFSDSGLALRCRRALPTHAQLLLEFDESGWGKPLHIPAEVVACEVIKEAEGFWQLRTRFTAPHLEELQNLRRYVMQLTDYAVFAVTGWGKATFPGRAPIETLYRDVALNEFQKLMDARTFLPAKETIYLLRFRDFLETALGDKAPTNFKVTGTKLVTEKLMTWVELVTEQGTLQLLAKPLWSRQEALKIAECGLQVHAWLKTEALRHDKKA